MTCFSEIHNDSATDRDIEKRAERAKEIIEAERKRIRDTVEGWRDKEIERCPRHDDPDLCEDCHANGNHGDTFNTGMSKGEINAYQRILDRIDGKEAQDGPERKE